ncbi:hypothetical protein GLYMA_02G230366v4 [Glycine max]|nr:hypothetical protein GLYMA_02G230366v4 [Glycine max]KAH1061692.1 hypothetical protein GYH30_004934 [Glycine max]
MLFFLFLLIQRGIQCLLRVSCHVCLLRQRQYCSEGIGQIFQGIKYGGKTAC